VAGEVSRLWLEMTLGFALGASVIILCIRLLLLIGLFYGLLALIFGIGLLLISPGLFHCAWPVSGGEGIFDCVERAGLFEKLGGELIVAVVLALVVDQFIKRKFAEEVTKDLLTFAAGHTLENPIRQKIADLIRTSYVRKNFSLKCELSDVPGRADLIRLTMTTEYEVHNLTDSVTRYRVRSSIEDTRWMDVEAPALKEFKLTGSTRFTLAGATLLQKSIREGPYVIYQRTVLLEPQGRTALKVQTERSAVYPHDWFYVLDILGPAITIGLTVNVERTRDYEWHVHFGAGEDLVEHPEPTRWVHPGVHMPGQFVRLTWTRKNP
jgi:hypothetical protein